MMQSHEVAQSRQGERRSKYEEIVKDGQLVFCIEHHQGHETHEPECQQNQGLSHLSGIFRFAIGFHQDVLACTRRLHRHLWSIITAGRQAELAENPLDCNVRHRRVSELLPHGLIDEALA